MNRVELYNHKPQKFSRKGLIYFLFTSMILAVGFFIFGYYYQNTIKIEVPTKNLGQKIIIHLPNGQSVYTYEKLIVEKDGKTYYQGELNTIDLTGGTVEYENWE
ncbi:MAG: hypothetical protein K6T88_08955 [Bacillus sp. (in: Bacteria)]|nr:hypothetical protein [Bacillus sp. (in: firmicutes)]